MFKLAFLFLCFIISFKAIDAAQVTKAAHKVLHFWFGDLNGPKDFPELNKSIWYGNNRRIDQDICQRFKLFMIAAANGQLNGWKSHPRGHLALIILLDQFPRYIYRGTLKAYKFDKMAQQMALEGIRKGADRQLLPIERAFFYMPLKHAENPHLQKISIDHFHRLVRESSPEMRHHYQNFHREALHQFGIIRQFGRFPHRNQVLGRVSTSKELDFLRK